MAASVKKLTRIKSSNWFQNLSALKKNISSTLTLWSREPLAFRKENIRLFKILKTMQNHNLLWKETLLNGQTIWPAYICYVTILKDLVTPDIILLGKFLFLKFPPRPYSILFISTKVLEIQRSITAWKLRIWSHLLKKFLT